jgi:hypothetical protein
MNSDMCLVVSAAMFLEYKQNNMDLAYPSTNKGFDICTKMFIPFLGKVHLRGPEGVRLAYPSNGLLSKNQNDP